MTTQLQENPLDLGRTYTLAEFLDLDLPEDDNDYELLRGKILARKKGGVSAKHGQILGRLMQHINNYLDATAKGRAYDQASCTLGNTDPEASWVEPDVSFVAAGRTPPEFSGPIPVAPDLIVEVWSPSDSTERIQEKLATYQAAGVKVVWSVYLLFQYVVIHKLNDTRRELIDLMDELDGSDTLPGFKLPVKTLFE